MQQCEDRHAENQRDQSLARKAPYKTDPVKPRNNKKWIHECRQVEQDGVKHHKCHSLMRVCVYHVSANGGIAYLNTRANYISW